MPITKTINFLPAIFQSDTNKKFLNATLDQLVTEPNLVAVSGYVGRKFAPGFTGISTYVKEPSAVRADYQLEPSVVVKDPITNEVDFHLTYPELLQQISSYGGKVDNQDRLWKSEYYSYDPKISLDAFINFSQYYWLPSGPDAVDVYAGTVDLEKTFYMYPDPGANVYYVSGYATAANPDIILARGGTYTFSVNQSGKPFWIQSSPGLSGKQATNPSLSSRQVLGVAGNGTEIGNVTFSVPSKDAQDLFVNMPVVQNVDFVTTVAYSNIQGQTLTTFNSTYGGFDGQTSSVDGKYLIFGEYYPSDASWTVGVTTVPANQRYGIWQIAINAGVIDLTYVTSIPVNQKVSVLAGVTYSNTEWYTAPGGQLSQVPVITALLDTLYYQDGTNADEYGIIKLVDVGSYTIDVDADILGKQNYVSPNGIVFTNGLKVKFDATATPATYQNKEYYVDGVGTGITLTLVDSLIINFAQSRNNFDPTLTFTAAANATLNLANDQLTITSTDYPYGTDIAFDIDAFPNSVNPLYVIEQDLTLKYPYRGGQDVQGDHNSIVLESGSIGITLPGILINGVANDKYVNGDLATKWHYDSNQALIDGRDQWGGAPVTGGAYVYKDSTFITANAWGNVSGFTGGSYTHADGHSKIIGYALDGYPIYGPFGYVDPTNAYSGTVRMTSSYLANNNGLGRPAAKTVTLLLDAVSTDTIVVDSSFGLNPGMRIIGSSASGVPFNSVVIIDNDLSDVQSSAPPVAVFAVLASRGYTIKLSSPITINAGDTLTFEFLAGAFIEDYQFILNSGSLDRFNGRFCVTPDFPRGTYAYFATQDINNRPVYPYFVGDAFYGSLQVDENTSLTTPDYVVINRASRDLNPWSRRNRWFHKDVIEATAAYNNTVALLDQTYRANRPIIEFIPDMQLYDFGKNGKAPVDLYDTRFTQPFLQIEGKRGANIDGVNLVDGMRVIFSADIDPTTNGKIWVVNLVDTVGTSPSDVKVIHLSLAADGNVQENDTVSIFNGVEFVGKSFWYTGSAWNEGQTKTSLNQAPLFDVFDSTGTSFGDRTKYPLTSTELSFNGTKIFGYKVGTGTNDPVLGFPLVYKNFNNVGDIQFENYFDTETFVYTVDKVNYTENVNKGSLYRYNIDDTTSSLNVWETVSSDSKQYQNISYDYNGINNTFEIDIKPDVSVDATNMAVYVNFKRLPATDYQLYNIPNNKQLVSIKPTQLSANARITFLIYNATQTSNLGFYEIPDNLNLNAKNETLSSPTLGELRNHVSSQATSSTKFYGEFPGSSNLRDIDVTTQRGTMLQQSAPVSYAAMFLADGTHNFVTSLFNAQHEYTRFKNRFLSAASASRTASYDGAASAVDNILKQLNAIKNKTFPWYYSDMVPYGDNKNTITYNIFNPAQKRYEITAIFSNTTLSNQAILVYLNGVQLLYGIDYTFLPDAPGVLIDNNVVMEVDDTLVIVEYNNTDGNYIPETPSKLGLYPKFAPEIYTDYTYITPTSFIKGHDGSLTPAFGDYRDDMLLELETRIFNNIKTTYDEKSFSIYDSIPGKYRDTGYSLLDFNNITLKTYLQWTGLNRLDYITNSTFTTDSPFTFNYGNALDSTGTTLPGSWRACFQYFYDTQHPDTAPWEMLGFSNMPTWWESYYGPAPYTSGNSILWTDLENGYIADGDRKGVDTRFVRPGLSAIIPVNENGEILPPLGLLTSNYNPETFNSKWNVGQWSPTETAWRNSSEYPFAVMYAAAMTQPAKFFALGIATNKYKFDTELGQYAVVDTHNRLTPADIVINGFETTAGTVDRAAGYLNWIGDYLISNGMSTKDSLVHYVQDYNVQLSYRMASFSGKQYLKVLAEQNSPNSVNESVIIPDADFDLVLGKSTPLANPRYSGVIVEKTSSGFKISGYDTTNPYFTIIAPAPAGKSRTVRVLDQAVTYPLEFANYKLSIPYDVEFTTVQQLVNFLGGYERYLVAQGFRFDYFDQDLAQIRNWELSAKEFLFWVQQSWAVGSVLVLSPIADNVRFVSQGATVDGISNSFYGSKVMTQNFITLDSDAYTVSRDGSNFKISLDNSAGTLIAFLDINLVQFEHVLIFNNKTQFNDIIYDPIQGQRQYRLKLVGTKTAGWSGTLTPEGFVYNTGSVETWRAETDYLRGDLVEYKNFYYAANSDLPGTNAFNFADWLPVDKNKIKTGLLSNFARNAGMSTDFYNVDKVNLESEFDKYALGLIGYRNRSYLANLGVDDTSQVKFYQGFIKEKGTKNAINAIRSITANDQTGNISINEEWAFRVGAYGSLDTNQFVELVLDESYTLNNPTSLEVVNDSIVVYSSTYTQAEEVYKTSKTPWASPFLLNRTSDSIRTDDIQTAGFVNIEDVDYTIFDLSIATTLAANISDVGVGSVIWVAKDYAQDWNVYRVSETNVTATEVSNSLNGKLTVKTDVAHGLVANDTILIPEADRYSGFYKVESVASLTSFIIAYPGSTLGLGTSTTDSPIYKLASLKFNRASEIASSSPVNGWVDNSKAWVIDNTNNKWAVYNKTSPWAYDRVLPLGEYSPNDKFGTSVKISADNNFALAGKPGYDGNIGGVVSYLIDFNGKLKEDTTISSTAANTVNMGASIDSGTGNLVAGAPGSSSSTGYAFIYSRDYTGKLAKRQILAPNASAGKFGYSVTMGVDDQWVYIGAPDNDSVYVYAFDPYIAGEQQTVDITNVAVATLSFTPSSTETLLISKPNGDNLVPYVDFALDNTNPNQVNFTANGSGEVTIVSNVGYRYVTTLTGNSGSSFGFSIATSTDGSQIVIGSPTANVSISNVSTQSGKISVYDRTIERSIIRTYNGGGSYFASANRPLTTVSRVFVNGVLQQPIIDYTVVSSPGNPATLQFANLLVDGTLVDIETDEFNLVQEIYPEVPYANQQFGYSLDFCKNNCSIYVGAPFQSSNGFYNGAAYRFVNQGKVYGTITSTNKVEISTTVAATSSASTLITLSSVDELEAGMYVAGTANVSGSLTIATVYTANNTVELSGVTYGDVYAGSELVFTRLSPSGESIRLNNFEVIFYDNRLDSVVSAINFAGIPGVSATSSNNYLVINSDSKINSNKLAVLPGFGNVISKLGLDVFPQTQVIKNPENHAYDYFGKQIKVNDNSDALFVGSDIANTLENTTFDLGTTVNSTTFDAKSTNFKDYIETSGSVWAFNYLNDSRSSITYPGQFTFSQHLTPYPGLKTKVGFGAAIAVSKYGLLVGASTDSAAQVNAGRVYQFDNPEQLLGWDVYRSESDKVDPSGLLKAYIYSVKNQSIIDSLDYIDPAKGKILGLAEQDITYKTDYDPAVYNNASDSTVSLNTSLHWNDAQVGQVWWDLSTIKYMDYEQGSIKYRTANWGREFPNSSVDVYEWVESIYPPSQYVARGGDGTPKFPNNTAFVTTNYVETETNQTTVKYYFWVKDKTTVSTNQFGRTIPTTSIADYIKNPKTSGVKYFAAIRDDSVAVYNVINDTTGKDTIFHLDYATELNDNIIHSEYALVSETNGKSGDIPPTIYNKLVDSASGIDLFGHAVPDPRLPVQSRYGIDIRPRQSMFVDRNAAIKEMVTYVNSVFADNVISQGYDLSTLNSAEPAPVAGSGDYDLLVDTYEQLGYVNIIIQPVGYKVLVQADTTADGLWTIYTKQTNNTWLLTRVQSYRTSDYWQYTDWYAPGFDSTVVPNFTVNTIADMQKLPITSQSLVKVLNNGQGKWVLLQVFANVTLTVGVQNGTIELSENLYKLSDYGLGFGAGNFDVARFDQNPSIETRKILQALRDDIFVNRLSSNFLELFFVFVYYVLDEQKYVDWVFKTSFINILHKFQGLDQPQIYNKDNRSYLQDYVEEVKPYRSTIREYIMDYEGSDNFTGYTTDFDVPAYYDPVLKMYRSPSGEFAQDTRALQSPQYQDWLLNYSYYVASFDILDGGSGYTTAPTITVTGSTINNNAIARAIISNGVLTKVEVLYPGTNYITQPVVTVSGGSTTPARVYAKLANDTVRKLKTLLVYDRVTYDTEVFEWTPNTSYTASSIVAYNGVAYQVVRDFTSGATFVGNDLTIYSSSKFKAANDRIQSYYDPALGQPGKNFGLLQAGIDYPGVTVEGPLFDDSGSFDVGGFDSTVFDPLAVNEDGTFIISDVLLDTTITSSYTDTQLGTRPEDIVVDGGGYVDTFSSHAPEELLPGRIYDTLDMTITTFATLANTAAYTYWVNNDGFYVYDVVLNNGGAGYTTTANTSLGQSNIAVTVSGTTGSGAAVSHVLDANGTIVSMSVVVSGSGYTTMPNVVITGSNTSPASASIRLAQNDYSTFSYRYFKSMQTNRYVDNTVTNKEFIEDVTYLSTRVSTTLASELSLTANTITVVNGSVLSVPNPSTATPGVVFINGERITYWTKNGNILSNIRRSTAGTGATIHSAGSIVTDGSASQVVPESGNYISVVNANVDVTDSTTASLPYTFKANVNYVHSQLWYDTGIGPDTIEVEFIANTPANVITTESSISLSTEQENISQPTGGNGLYASSKQQAVFVRQV